MTNFTPVSGLIGGLMIGLASAMLVLLCGRTAGISGILGGLFGAPSRETGWRAAFVAGLVIGPLAVAAAGVDVPGIAPVRSLPVLIAAGLLVGFGTRLGGGCTSGHGVCGMARGSPRSLAATATFFAVAVIAVFVMRHVVGG